MVELSLNFNVPEGKLTLTEAAANRINELLELDGRVNTALSIKVVPGGCAGFSYEMGWVPTDSSGKKFER
ncbi:MAG: HesB/IscA family protein, partial [Candidatus Kariarchaeaceae archaeon]